MTEHLDRSNSLVKEARSFHTKKNLGQNFLCNQEKLNAIVDSLSLKAGDNVIEIGAGIGFLTRLLAKHNIKITAVDLDRQCIEYLQQLHLKNVNVQHGDFLSFDLNTLSFFDKETKTKETQATPLKIVGNVPYQITGRIIGHLLGEIGRPSPWLNRIECIVLTVQKEVAERLAAKPRSKDYSRASILMNYFGTVKIETIIDPYSFFPAPKIHSAIIKITPEYPIKLSCKNHILLKQIIEAGFRQRRKMLKKNLAFTHLSKEDIDDVFKTLNLDPQSRAEVLSLEQFAKLTDVVEAKKQNG